MSIFIHGVIQLQDLTLYDKSDKKKKKSAQYEDLSMDETGSQATKDFLFGGSLVPQ